MKHKALRRLFGVAAVLEKMMRTRRSLQDRFAPNAARLARSALGSAQAARPKGPPRHRDRLNSDRTPPLDPHAGAGARC